MTSIKRCLTLGVFLVLAMTPRASLAQRAAADVESARELYIEGRELRERGDLRGALEKLKAAHALGKTPITGLELAKTHADLHQPLDARELCLSIARMPVSPEETSRSADARKEAAKMAEDVKPKIATLRIKINGVPQGTEPTLLIDGITVPFAAIAEPRKVNPGAHQISARIGAGQEAKSSIELTDGETMEAELTVVAPPVSTAPTQAPGSETAHPRSDTTEAKRSPLVIPGFAVAAAGIGVGAITGILALSAKSDLAARCEGTRCGPEAYDDLDSARAMGTVSTLSFIIGVAGAIVGTYGLTHPVQKAQAVAVRPYVGTRFLGVHGSF